MICWVALDACEWILIFVTGWSWMMGFVLQSLHEAGEPEPDKKAVQQSLHT